MRWGMAEKCEYDEPASTLALCTEGAMKTSEGGVACSISG
jgi:hypothetical protein